MVQHFLAHTAPRPFILTMSIRRPGVAITISLPPARILGIGDLCKDVKLVDERPVQSSAGGGIPEQRGPRIEQEIMLQYTCYVHIRDFRRIYARVYVCAWEGSHGLVELQDTPGSHFWVPQAKAKNGRSMSRFAIELRATKDSHNWLIGAQTGVMVPGLDSIPRL